MYLDKKTKRKSKQSETAQKLIGSLDNVAVSTNSEVMGAKSTDSSWILTESAYKGTEMA